MIQIKKACYLLMGLFFITPSIDAQNQSIADSLLLIYEKDILGGEEKLELLRNLSFNLLDDLELSTKIADELIALSQAQDNQLYLYRGYLQKGNGLKRIGELDQALEAYFNSANKALEINYNAGVGSAYQSIADVYSSMGNENNAETYYDKAIDVLRIASDSIALGAALLNAGDLNFKIGNLDKALFFFEESGQIFEDVDYKIGMAYNIGNLGLVYASQDKDELAKEKINEAVSILTVLGDHYPICVYLNYMADIYAKQNDLKSALTYAQQSFEMANEHGLKKEISDAHLKLSELYKVEGDITKAYYHYEKHIQQRDNINNLESVEKMADLRTTFEFSQKQTEVDLLNQQKRSQRIMMISALIIASLIGILAFGLFRRNKFTEMTKKIIEEEKQRSDDLLLNILPEETANELKVNGTVAAKRFESVTVMFTDFKGFTKYAEKMSPEQLVKTIDYYFSAFDQIIEKYGIEKIKTIGDAYMCACGLPDVTDDHAITTLNAAMEIADFVENSKKGNDSDFEIRIGINSGSVVAGIVGTKKFAYDIWGDTVNIASRMESTSEPGRINVSDSTYQQVKDHYKLSFRGEMEIKNRGKLKMYFVENKLELTSV